MWKLIINFTKKVNSHDFSLPSFLRLYNLKKFCLILIEGDVQSYQTWNVKLPFPYHLLSFLFVEYFNCPSFLSTRAIYSSVLHFKEKSNRWIVNRQSSIIHVNWKINHILVNLVNVIFHVLVNEGVCLRCLFCLMCLVKWKRYLKNTNWMTKDT